MTTLPPPDDEDGRRDAGQPRDWAAGSSLDRSSGDHSPLRHWAPLPDGPLPDGVVVPDDLSSLDDEVAAYRRERAAQRRHDLLSRMLLTRRWYRYGLSGPLVVAVLLVVAVGGAMLSFLAPSPGQRPGTAALAPLARTARAVGQRGGLLPDVTVSGEEGTLSVRTVRPAVMLLVPAGCGCADLARAIGRQADAAGVGLQTAVVGPVNDAVVTALAADPAASGERVRVLADVSGGFAGAFPQLGTTPLLLAVQQDGVLAADPRPVRPGDVLTADIAALVPAAG